MRDLLTRLSLCCLLWLALPLTGTGAAGDLLVIVHPDVKVDKLSTDELAAIFTLSRREWSGGVRIAPFNYEAETPLRIRFDRAVLDMDETQVARYWIDRRIRGGGAPPRKLPSVAVMLRVVATWPGAIGYVPEGVALHGVKVVARIVDGQVLPRKK